jgi:dipeptidyl-peptidase 4
MFASFLLIVVAFIPNDKPSAYILPPSAQSLVGKLQDAGARVEQLREDLEVDARTLGGSIKPTSVSAGSFILRTGQPVDLKAKELIDAFAGESRGGSQDEDVLELPTPAPLHTSPAIELGKKRTPPKPLTPEIVLGGDDVLSLDGDPISEIHWIDDERYLVNKRGPNGEALAEVQAQTGRSRPVGNTGDIAKALAKLDAIGPANASKAAAGRRGMNEQKTANLVEYQNDLYIAMVDGSSAFRLTATPGKEETPKFSPDGKFVAYVRDNNLCVADVSTKTERQLTTDGGGPIRNGKASWVYFEEVYDRRWDAFWWSPDSQNIVFLRFDETLTPIFQVTNEIPLHQNVERTAYPKVGDPNPLVKIGVAHIAGSVKWIDVPSAGGEPLVFSRVGWRSPKEIFFTAQNRTQTYMDLFFAPLDSEPRRIFHETTKAWVFYELEPKFLKDGSFIFPSERTGWKHLYLYDANGKLVRAVTSGEWEVRKLLNIDEAKGEVAFTGTKDNPIGERPYKAKLDGSGVVAQSRFNGTTQWASYSPNGRYYVEAWSDSRTPTQAALFFADGRLARRIDTNPVHVPERFQVESFEFVKILTKDGFTLEGAILRPKNFDANKKYPVWISTYGGPHMPTVRESWAGGRVPTQMLAQQGFVVFHVDPRSASGKGAVSAWAAYKQLGVTECKDMEEAVAWLIAKYPYCDASRVGIEGTSYGGYLTSYCLTHSKAFAAGIAGAPVTDWRNYDSLYTERYMLTPAENPDGYKVSSVVKAAGDLHGKLLLIHGMMDDNVHPQNTLQLAQEFQKAGKLFEMMIYPTARHGGWNRRHFEAMRMDFIKRALGGPEEGKK